jgi:hypothetical protein
MGTQQELFKGLGTAQATTEARMKITPRIARTWTFTVAASWALACHGGQGLSAPHADHWWPQWQARLSLQTAAPAGLSVVQRGSSSGAAGGIQGGALLGDYYFARPWAGTLSGYLRASGGLMLGPLGAAPISFAGPAAPVAGAAPATRLGLSLLAPSMQPAGAAGSESADAVPYVGFGYSGSLWGDSVSLTADLGLVSQRPGAAGNLGRAVFGNQGMNQALRDMRLSPVMQLGMRYSF